jgi:hypothetical protein
MAMLNPILDDDDLDDVDREALQRAMAMAMEDRADQLTGMLEHRPWVEVAEFASYHVQMKTLRLAPWQAPPCHGYWLQGDKVQRDPHGGDLCDKLLDAGLSMWEPDPAAALAKAKKRCR